MSESASDPEPLDPYAPPKAAVHLQGDHCPRCAKPMQTGYLRSSSAIKWENDSDSMLRKAFIGGESIGKILTGIGCRHKALRCKECHLFVLIPP